MLTNEKENTYYIDQVSVDTPAHKAGLQCGDIILEINGESIRGVSQEDAINKMLTFPKHIELIVAESLNGK